MKRVSWLFPEYQFGSFKKLCRICVLMLLKLLTFKFEIFKFERLHNELLSCFLSAISFER